MPVTGAISKLSREGYYSTFSHSGKSLHIVAKNNSAANKYIQSISFNGKAYDKAYITYEAIKAGGELIIAMGAQPSQTWGIDKATRPH